MLDPKNTPRKSAEVWDPEREKNQEGVKTGRSPGQGAECRQFSREDRCHFSGGFQNSGLRRTCRHSLTIRRREPPFRIVNLHEINYMVRKGVINPAEAITIKVLNDVGLAKKIKSGVKILAKGAEKFLS